MAASLLTRTARRAGTFMFLLLAIEFLDEFIYGVREAAWPLVRDDLNLSYTEVGLLLGLPGLLSVFIEPFIGFLGDTRHRRTLMLVGALGCGLAALLTAVSTDFALLMISFMVFYPSSGAFVGLAQASLMDAEPQRHEQNMARWELAGSIGVVAGPLALGILSGDWRWVYAGMAAAWSIAFLVAFRFRRRFVPSGDGGFDLRESVRGAVAALRQWSVTRWLILLEFSNLMMDVLHGYLALYFVDVVGTDEGSAGVAILIWTGVGLVGDTLLIPLLERVRGLTYLRFSAGLLLFLYPAFLLVPSLPLKLVLLAILGVFNAGWYSVLQGQLYTAMPNKSGTVMAIGSASGVVGSLIPLIIGGVAQAAGLDVAMWLLLLGPIALLVGLPLQKLTP